MPPLEDNSASADRGRWRIHYPNLQLLSESGYLVQSPETIRHSNAVMALAYSRDGGLLATGAEPDLEGSSPGSANDAEIFIWNTSDKTIKQTLKKGRSQDYRAVSALAFSPDGKRIALGDNCAQLEIWDVESGMCLKAIPARVPKRAIHSLAWSPDGRWIVSGYNDARVRLWDAQTYAQKEFKLPRGQGSVVTSVCFSPNSRWVASGTEDCGWCIWSMGEEDGWHWCKKLPDCRGLMWLGDSDADDRQLVTCMEDGSVHGWSFEKDGRFEDCECAEALSGYSVWKAAFSEDGSSVLTTSRGSPSAVRLRDLSERKIVFEGEIRHIKAMCISPDGKYVAFACRSLDFTACVWRVRDCTLIGINQHDAEVERIMFSPDGATFASGSCDGAVCIRSVEGKGSGGA